jgi:CheY-like chemotaxis protein
MIRVLLADDDKNLRRVLTSELSGEGFTVDEAKSAPETMAFLEKEEYDVLILDLNMPGVSGMEVLRKIKDLETPRSKLWS